MTAANLEVLFRDTLSKMYYAEQRIAKALPKMQAAAQSADLQAAFETHLDETMMQIDRLQQVFELLGEQAIAKTCPVTDALVQAGDQTVATYQGSSAIDAALIAAAQGVEHHEIAQYGSLCSWAVLLEMDDASDLLNQSLTEELATDDALTDLADTSINEAALRAA
jgi:ferritin-like metal-binding protein YciE